VVAEIHGEIGTMKREAGDPDGAIVAYRRALSGLEDTPQRRTRAAAELQTALALTLFDVGDLEGASEMLEQAEWLLDELGERFHPSTGLVLLARGRVQHAQGRLEDAVATLERSADRLGHGDPRGVEARSALAAAELERGRPLVAQRHVEAAIALLDRVGPSPRVRAEARFVQARVAHAIDGTGRSAAIEALGLWAAQPHESGARVLEVSGWLEDAAPED
jgi:tetratricopeptide (TPR) repeat protein